MEWSDIHDPKGEYGFILDWSEVSGSYDPELIQKIINDDGVEKMVEIINEHFWLTSNRKPLVFRWHEGQKVVMQR